MKSYISALVMIFATLCPAQDKLKADLEKSYGLWRQAIISKNGGLWQRITAEHRRIEVKNRIISQKLPFPAAVFDLPTPPPGLQGLKFLNAKQNGPTAKAAYFGKVDFGVGREPTDNLLVLSFVNTGATWLYDKADYVNLTALPDVRNELAKGDLSYLEGVPEAKPSGITPQVPIAVNPATTIAKVYVFCPGREVNLQVNKISRHRFANAKEAELIIGGGRDGINEIQYSIRKLEGGTDQEAMTIRVYLMSEVPGIQPLKVFEYQIAEKAKLTPVGTGTFVIDAATIAKLKRK